MVDAAAVANLQTRSGNAFLPILANQNLAPIRDATLAFMDKIVAAFPTAPRDLRATAAELMDTHGEFPRLNNTGTVVWTQTPDQKAAWAKVTAAYSPIQSKVVAGMLAQAAIDIQDATYRADFWAAVSKYTGVDALEKVWDDMWKAIDAMSAQRKAALVAIDRAEQIIKDSGGKAPADLVTGVRQAQVELNALDIKARAVLSPLGAEALGKAGLGIAPLVIAGIAAASVVAITTSVWAIAREFSAVQMKAADNAQALIKWREEQDRQDYNAGKLTEPQYMARRASTVAAGTQIMDSQGAAAVGMAVGRAGMGVAAAVAGFAALGLGVFFLLKKMKSK